jgi:DNA repair protein RadA/Sms
MAKQTAVFSCQNCDYQSPKWMGQCPECGKWNTMVEEVKEKKSSKKVYAKIEPIHLNQIKTQKIEKRPTKIRELDRVLGEGLVAGQVILFAGEPGIGKSTLLTQLAINISANEKKPVVYGCGEESPSQVGLRVERLADKKNNNIVFVPDTDVDQVVNWLEQNPPPLLLIVDSIQTLTTQDLSGVAGSVGQVRESAQRLITWAKKSQVPLLIVGHVTKQGNLAGPKVLEHAVDTVIYFEGERSHDLRILRTIKNRFGPTDEIGVFQMTGKGLLQVDEKELARKVGKSGSKAGSCLTVTAEGNRMMVTEIQALVTQSFTPFPKRVITGLSKNRTEMLIAVCQKQLSLPLYKYDVFINVAGGVKINEPAADLAICAAIYSSLKNKPLPPKSSFVGEISLLGEVNTVPQPEKRAKQAKGVGLSNLFGAKNIPTLKDLKKQIQ